MSKKVGIWIRVSTDDQARGDSPKHHEERAKYYAKAKDWEIAETYHLEGVSGKAVMDHPETIRMLDDIASGKISGLIFSKLARLARHTKQLLDFAEIFKQHNADLISLQENIDTSSPAGRLFYTLIAAMAQWEREEIAERVAASVPIRASLGKPLGGAAPYGYMWKNQELYINEEEAPVRKLMFELFIEHKRKKTVARILNESGYRTRNGSKFSDTTVGRLLADPIAKGLRRANYTRSSGEGKHWNLKSEDDWVFSPAPRIVSDETWDACNAILENQQKNRRATKKSIHLFSGLMYCHCGEKMYVLSNSPKYTCQKCRNKILATDMEEIYQSQLQEFLISDHLIAEHLQKFNKAIVDKTKLLSKLQKEYSTLRSNLNELIDLHHKGELPTDGFRNHYQPIFDQYQQIERQIPEIQGEIDFMKEQQLSSDQVIQDAKDLYGRWSTFNREEKRSIIESITDRITIGEKDINILLIQIAPTSLPNSKNTTFWQRNSRGSLPLPT